MIDATMTVSLPGDYLRKVDMMSMAHGLEVRVPFLGARMLESRLAYSAPLEASAAESRQAAAEKDAARIPARRDYSARQDRF